MKQNDPQDKDQLIAKLQAEIDTLQTIISMMPGHVYWKDVSGRYMGCNQNLADVLKLSSPSEIIGKTDEDLIGPELAKKTTLIDLEVLRCKQEKRIEETGFDSEGKPAIYLTQKSPLQSHSGQIKGILGISLDISARKQIEDKLKIAKRKAEAANRAKSQFLAMISHELRTPLTSILGLVSFLEQDTLNEKEKKLYIHHITNSGSYLFSLINNLLDYNKLETNNYESNHDSLDLKNLTQEVMSMLSGSAKLKNLVLTLDYDDKVPEYIVSDSRVLRQILVNLIGNAIKFTDKGSITLKVKCIVKTKESSTICISVKDTGVGIPNHELKSIFKRFYQLGNVYTRNTSLTGTGLGLAIVKKLVKIIGSKIEIQSIPNQGSTFYFTTCFQHGCSPIQSPQSTSLVQQVPSYQKPHILLVEDDALIQLVHKQMLKELGGKVTIAECANNALNILEDDYDIAFIDIGLPDMNGFELIKTIRNQYFKNIIPIIALTGYSEEEERQQCLNAGANEVALKPISKIALGEILERYGLRQKN